ncbi:uncharacterized protein F5891DRAFT_983249 [Suillus fuscotomentosus]|uniref:No apical meristem-associated C-terminal domain-containing protein n=1 Tax=Suillus fuscotomentosus TaxID=1912939 RepID=A0AAD4DYV6_9AGAM|nr:uncharacterized protein F5891DRAFT_983249 [Suillus fuscotomentosus]KAG1896634.1 hypothetical protein F5891DRAFT_983249 [Suillus fuscotomentosus]
MDGAEGIGLPVVVTTTHPHLQVEKEHEMRNNHTSAHGCSTVPRGGKSWPASADEACINEMTGEHYLMPEFTKTVNDDHNCMIFAKVASLVWQDLQNMANSDCLVNCKVKWNKQSLFIFVKEMYHGFKEDWWAQNDAEKKAAKGVNKRNNRCAQHCKEKADWLMTACQAYIEKFSVDPVDLVHADHMSDEASGPDDDELEDDWK